MWPEKDELVRVGNILQALDAGADFIKPFSVEIFG
jgi:hypothetical protein